MIKNLQSNDIYRLLYDIVDALIINLNAHSLCDHQILYFLDHLQINLNSKLRYFKGTLIFLNRNEGISVFSFY